MKTTYFNWPLSKKIATIAFPLIIANCSTPLVGIVDTALLGHLKNVEFLAASAVASTVITFIFWAFGFLRMGTTSHIAQAHGANQPDYALKLLQNSCLMAFFIGFTILSLHQPLIKLGLTIIKPSAGSIHYAYEYATIRIFAAPACLLNYVFLGWFIAKQDTRNAMQCTLLLNTINIVFDYILINNLSIPSNGAAFASLIAEYSCCIFAVTRLKNHYQISFNNLLPLNSFDLPIVKKIASTNFDLFIRLLLILSSMSFFTAQSAGYGSLILAANTILLQLVMLCSYAMDGFANATEALCGEAHGAKNTKRLINICYNTALISLVVGIAFLIAFYLFKTPIISLFTSNPSLINHISDYYYWAAFLPLIAVWCYLLDGIFIGIGETRSMRNGMLLSVLILFVSYYLLRGFSNHGLWLAFILFHLSRSLTLLPYLIKALR